MQMWNTDKFCKKCWESLWCKTRFKEMYSIINLNFLFQLRRNVRCDVIFYFDVNIIVRSCLFSWFLRFRIYVVLTLFLFDHLNFFHNLFLLNFLFFSLFLWVLKCRTCFFLGFCGLWNFRITDLILIFNAFDLHF